MKSNSKQAATTGMLCTAPPITTSASVSPVFSSASFSRSGYLLAVLELQRVDRQHFLADLVAAFGVEEGVEPRARADAVVVAALRADVLVLLQVGLVEHRLAGRALDPQAFGHRAALARVGLLDLRRQQFFEPAHRVRSFVDYQASSAARISAMKRRRRAGTHCRAAASSSSWIEPRCRSPPRRPPRPTRLRRRRVADAEAHADRQLHMRADARQHLLPPRRCRGGRRRSRP